MPDPREGLKPGKYDAGEAALNMKLVKNMRQPEGMFDPNPAGGRGLDYANSDLAFGQNGRLALQGNFHGLIFYNIEDLKLSDKLDEESCETIVWKDGDFYNQT